MPVAACRWFLCAAILWVAAPVLGQDRVAMGEKIVAEALNSPGAYEILAHLTDRIGPRLSGSRNADLAVRWTTEQFRQWGIPVRNERVMVPRWVRGAERARLVSHNNQRLVLTTLGGSVATPAEGITADVIEVRSLDELPGLGRAKIAGRIVFYSAAMDMKLVEAGSAFAAYSKAADFRSRGADAASKYGALAVVTRSVASASLRTPHTGALRYKEGRKIPAAALAAEDAMHLQRLLAKGDRVRLNLVLTPQTLADVASANVVAEIRGVENPQEIVLIGGHLDSWDVGTGAIDNGAGVAMVMETMRLFKQLGIRPRRTIRCVLFMNEENGLRGGRAYAADHAAELDRHVAAIESDGGASKPMGFRTTLGGADRDAFAARMNRVLRRVGATEFATVEKHTGADTSRIIDAGVPGFGYASDPRHYFDYHHSPADTLDKVDRDELNGGVAAIAALAYLISEEDQPIPRPAKRKSEE